MKIGDDDELGTFIFRTTGFNSIRTLAARLSYYQAVSGNLLACMPLELRIRGKSTTQSHRAAIYYVDITVRESMSLEEAIAQARETDARRQAVGYDQDALDAAAWLGFGNAAFETTEDEVPEILEEFFPEDGSDYGQAGDTAQTTTAKGRPSLKEKLDDRATKLGEGQEPARIGSIA
jgi:hypothetical protein